jgi:hypothetical protein
MRALLTVTLLALATAVAAIGSARAQDEAAGGTSFVTPFPAGDVYQAVVIGDSLAEGLLGGLVEAFQGDARLQIQRKPRELVGLTRSDFEGTMRALEEALQREPVHIAVVMVGVWDRYGLRNARGKRIPVDSEEWRAEYGRRADLLMKALKRRGVAVYWVGLPSLRRYEANEDAQVTNEVVRERAYLNGLKYIDAYAGFADEGGGYSAYGPDETGKIRLLREADGVHLTDAGNRKLAHFVEREIRRDLVQAKNERDIPLAGGEAEQAKIRPEKQQPASAPAAAVGGARAPKGAGAEAHAGEKADNGRVNLRAIGPSGREEIIALDILRPAIPASIVALVTRRESPDKAAAMGDTLIDQIPGGLTVMSSVTPASEAGGARRKLSPTQSSYYRVLVKGERLPPRPGRADDTSWPRAQANAGPEAPTPAVPARSERP